MQRKYLPNHTFSHTPSPTQIFTYILFLFHVATFYAIIQTNLKDQNNRIIMHALFPVSLLGQIISTLKTSLCDPSDHFMVKYLSNSLQDKDTISDKLFCDMCLSYVQSASKHCKKCGRCVFKFDHHCTWINNCIGQDNYISFMCMICFTFSTMMIYEAGVILLWIQGNWSIFLAQMIVIWTIGMITLIMILLIGNLIVFHIYLMCREITTYEFIFELTTSKIGMEQQKNKTLQIFNTNEQQQFPEYKNSKNEQQNIFESHESLYFQNSHKQSQLQSYKAQHRQSSKTGDLKAISRNIDRYNNTTKLKKPSQRSQSQEQSQSQSKLSNYFKQNKMINIFMSKRNAIHPINHSQRLQNLNTHKTFPKKSVPKFNMKNIKISNDYK